MYMCVIAKIKYMHDVDCLRSMMMFTSMNVDFFLLPFTSRNIEVYSMRTTMLLFLEIVGLTFE